MVRRDVVVEGVRTTLRLVEGQSIPFGGDAVVFVHGNPGPSDDWDHLATDVAQLGPVLTLDMPGFGRSERPRRFSYTVEGYAQHLGATLDAVDVHGAHLVLHDFGGPWGLMWALRHPERVRSITLVNTGLLVGYRWHWLARVWQTPILGELSMRLVTADRMHENLNRINPKPVSRAFVERVMSFSDPGHHRAVLALYRNSRDMSRRTEEMVSRIRTFDFPTCVVWGTEDKYVPVRFAEMQKRAFPSARVHRIENAGHWPFLDEPASVADKVVSFLREMMATPQKG